MSGDAHHIVTPPSNGSGTTALCMTRALAHAGASARDISYINAHATSTPMGASVGIAQNALGSRDLSADGCVGTPD